MTIFNKSRKIVGLRITHEYGTTEWFGKRFMLYVILKKAFINPLFRSHTFVPVSQLSDKAWDVNCSFAKNIPFNK